MALASRFSHYSLWIRCSFGLALLLQVMSIQCTQRAVQCSYVDNGFDGKRIDALLWQHRLENVVCVPCIHHLPGDCQVQLAADTCMSVIPDLILKDSSPEAGGVFMSDERYLVSIPFFLLCHGSFDVCVVFLCCSATVHPAITAYILQVLGTPPPFQLRFLYTILRAHHTSIVLGICGAFVMSYRFLSQNPLIDFANWSFGFRKGSTGDGGNDDMLARTCILLGGYSTFVMCYCYCYCSSCCSC